MTASFPPSWPFLQGQEGGNSLARSLIDAQKSVAGGGLRFLAIPLLILSTLIAIPAQTGIAANTEPTTVKVSYTRSLNLVGGGKDSFMITAGYSDGSTKLAQINPHVSGQEGTPTSCYINYFPVSNCNENYAESSQLPGIVFTWTAEAAQIKGTGYEPSTDCAGDYCVTAALKEKPATNVTQVYSVPGTGLPDGLSSIGMMSMVVAAAGMGLVVVRRRMAV